MVLGCKRKVACRVRKPGKKLKMLRPRSGERSEPAKRSKLKNFFLSAASVAALLRPKVS